MKPRLYEKSDYPTICKWWKDRNFTEVAEELLPEIGIVIDNHCAGFIYKTDSKFCMFEWMVSNPSSNSKERNEAMNLMLETMVHVAQGLGFKFSFTSLADDKLIDRFEKNGFIKTDINMTNFLRRL